MATMLRSKGLITYKSELLPPEGALTAADNVVIDEEGVVEPRRGFKDWGTALPLNDDRIKQLLLYKDRVLHHYDNILSFDNTDNSGDFLPFDGTYTELEDGLRIKYQEANGNLYFTTIEGIKKISAKLASEFSISAGYIKNAGGLKALDILLAANGTSGWLEPGYQVAYRVVWGIKDKNENLILGTPSSRVLFTNVPADTSAVTFTPDIKSIPVSLDAGPNHINYTGITVVNNDIIYFETISTTTSLLVNTNYYVVNSTPTTFQVSLTQGGTALDVDISGTGVITQVKSTVNLTAHGFVDGSQVYFTNITENPGVETGTKYYVTNSAANTFQLSNTPNGDFLILSAGTATVVSLTNNPSVNVQLAVQIPSNATDQHFIQVYRTQVINSATLPENIFDGAGDEMQQVSEHNYDGVSNPLLVIDDVINEFQSSGAYLYTNQISAEGISQANDRPPIAKDLCLFRGSLFYANTKVSHKYSLNLLSADSLDGYTLAIGNQNVVRLYVFQDYDASVDPNPTIVTGTGGIVGADQSGTPSQNIDTTARNLSLVINQDSANPVAAYYLSTSDTLPGLILLENDVIEDIPFYLAIDNASLSLKFKPTLPVITPITISSIQTSTEVSDNEESPNRVYYSKPFQPEAVPTFNYIDIGTKDKAVQRIIALRDSLFVLKEDGVYIITGAVAPNFSSRLLDNSAPIIAPDSASVLNNRIYCLSTQGIIAISETGVQVLSLPIENLIKDATKEGIPYTHLAVGVGYENDRSYLIWLPTNSTDEHATQAFRYNTFTDSWTRFTLNATALLVHTSQNKMYFGAGDKNTVMQERKARNRFDYAEREFTVGILDYGSVQDTTIFVNNTDGISTHDAVVQEQWINIPFFNRMLTKLDNDSGLTTSLISGGSGYSAYSLSPGDFLRTKLIALDAALAADATIGTYTPVTFGFSFVDLQTNLNSLITQLNSASTNTVYKNYRESDGTTYVESIITGVNKFLNTIEVAYAIPLLYSAENPITIYKAIPSIVEWAPQHFGAPDKLKQIPSGTVLLDHNNFYSAIISYQSDISRDFHEIQFYGQGAGVWGLQSWGDFNWGGAGSNTPFRTLIPTSKQRCRYLTCRFAHMDARNKFRLIGISLIPREVSDRGYR